MKSIESINKWVGSGSPWVWLSAGMVSLNLVMVFGLLFLISVRGLGHFWPAAIESVELREKDGSTTSLLGNFVEDEIVSAARVRGTGSTVPEDMEFVRRYLIKVGNRDVSGADFVWVNETDITSREIPLDSFMAERDEWGNFYGNLISVKLDGEIIASGATAWGAMQDGIARKTQIRRQIKGIEKDQIGKINYAMERLRLRTKRLELDGVEAGARIDKIAAERLSLEKRYEALNGSLSELYKELGRYSITAATVAGQQVELPVSKIVRAIHPNQMSMFEKIRYYFAKMWEFVSEDPREANTEGGVFPAIFGTVLLVMLMSVFVTPFGVIAAVYLREYAHQGLLTRTIRIAVNNLAGVPSIVYGVFGLGFFVYFLGGNIDQLFFPESLPAPTFGTPGILWSALTLAILTVPVVIVSTEEGLTRIPRAIREGSLALGATKAETLWRTVLPMATPAMMTGLILSIARAAGEVAPLMMVGVVKLAPSLPMDGNFPFLHVDRKFMHLGFHIYDVGFQSPNVEAARPLVYATAFLLVVLIVALNIAAIRIRNRLRESYKAGDG
ncbi:MAG: phosphate ABC transporter permease PstA [Proteobacteria bacterium]|nr:phosphate ABC transporter permease PstA [Pseudomonadota bacterium]